MTEDKAKRLIVAITVGSVLLIVILSFVMLYGMIKIRSENKAINELNAEIRRYEQLLSEGQDTLETRSMRWWIERRAMELGYRYDGSGPVS